MVNQSKAVDQKVGIAPQREPSGADPGADLAAALEAGALLEIFSNSWDADAAKGAILGVVGSIALFLGRHGKDLKLLEELEQKTNNEQTTSNVALQGWEKDKGLMAILSTDQNGVRISQLPFETFISIR